MRLRWIGGVLLAAWPVAAGAQEAAVRVAAVEGRPLSEWDAQIEQMLRRGELASRWERADTLVPGRRHDRLRQLHGGVPVYGGELVRQTEGARTVSVFGTFYPDIDVSVRPALTAEQAVAVVERLTGRDVGIDYQPELVVLPEEGRYHLCYKLRAAGRDDLMLYFVDAHTGAVVHQRSDLQTQAAVGTGTGVFGDRKKMSTTSGPSFTARDELRPPPLGTFDMKGDVARMIRFLSGEPAITAADVAQDADNVWTDGVVVDAHSYLGWSYDYFFKRFDRRGLDNADLPLFAIVHPVRREDIGAHLDDPFVINVLYLNAFYNGRGVMVFGEGLPAHLRLSNGEYVDYFAAALDVVTHEYTHGVTDYSSNLIYQGESGALNEAFSDIMGAGAEFFFQPVGSGTGQADYLVGEDIWKPAGLRSMADPRLHGDPDHYSRRFTGPGDNGGVHINSGIVNNAFYLAVEGGANRTSGLSVQGVGAANREQIEKVFYRAFVFMLPPSANFSTARAATIQAARDLYGAGSPAERATAQAWAAVGVQ